MILKLVPAITHTTEIENGVSVDIGGGSTEVTLFKDKELFESHSFPFGVVTLKESSSTTKIITTKVPLRYGEIPISTI